MKFSSNKKEIVKNYLLEKIAQGESNVTAHVAEVMGINRDTIYTYIKEMISDGTIRRVKRGQYEICSSSETYVLSRADGDLDSDMYAYPKYLAPLIKEWNLNVQKIWGYTLSEMVNNVIDHSEAAKLELTIKKSAVSTIVILIDDGVGIFNKIKDHFGLPTYEDVLCELSKGKLTTDSSKHSGEGIYFTSRAMDKFVILSDDIVYSMDKYDNEFISELPSGKGTLVYMELSNTSNKVLADIFHMYENEDGEFKKSKIPLKNFFDAAPVSRSQAKRVCNRLEGFEEVIIDCDGIEWMGQGFADQIFRVFANEYPNLHIRPENMNEDVRKMYNHVVGL